MSIFNINDKVILELKNSTVLFSGVVVSRTPKTISISIEGHRELKIFRIKKGFTTGGEFFYPFGKSPTAHMIFA